MQRFMLYLFQIRYKNLYLSETKGEFMKINKINSNIPFIKKENFRLFFPENTENSYNQNIKYWLKTSKIIALKRGIYIFPQFWEKCPDKNAYLCYLASILYFPSYVSKETVLAKYGMLSEAVYGISSVTTKTPRSFSSKISFFGYSKIKTSLFLGFSKVSFANYNYYIASKSKALFDYLYFYKRKLSRINKNTIEELRLNFDNMQDNDWQEFEKYLDLAKSKKLNLIYKNIKR